MGARAPRHWEVAPRKNALHAWHRIAAHRAYVMGALQKASAKIRNRLSTLVVHGWKDAVTRQVVMRRNATAQGLYLLAQRVYHAYYHAWKL